MSSSMRTPLGRVRGLGSAKEGINHFMKQRASAIALVFLVPWMIYNIVLIACCHEDAAARFEAANAFLTSPLNAIFALIAIGASLYHMRLGIQVVIEDYIHASGTKIFLLLLNSFVTIGLFAIAFYSVFTVAA